VTSATGQMTAEQEGVTLHRALSDPSRVRILEALKQAETPLDARELATLVGLHVNSVRSHLRLLTEAGLVSEGREQRSRAGRPRLLYQATAEPPDADAQASYRLLAQILASQLAGSEHDPSARAEQAGRTWGAHLVHEPPPHASISKEQTIEEVVRLHDQFGFRPELRPFGRGQELLLNRCPFQEVATSYQAVICPLHLGLIRGALAKLATGVNADSLEPFAEPGACVGHLTGT
jgi:predicted ArsR family transcriptional regulator